MYAAVQGEAMSSNYPRRDNISIRVIKNELWDAGIVRKMPVCHSARKSDEERSRAGYLHRRQTYVLYLVYEYYVR